MHENERCVDICSMLHSTTCLFIVATILNQPTCYSSGATNDSKIYDGRYLCNTLWLFFFSCHLRFHKWIHWTVEKSTIWSLANDSDRTRPMNYCQLLCYLWEILCTLACHNRYLMNWKTKCIHVILESIDTWQVYR
jgi:hypothetical protein